MRNLLLAAAFVVTWSSGFIGTKLATGHAEPLTILMWRFLPLAAVLGVISWMFLRSAWRGVTRQDVIRQAAIGVLSQSGYLLTVFVAIELGVSTGTTALIDGTQPLVAGALAGPLLGRYVSGRQWLGLVLGLAGVLVVTGADAAAAVTAGTEVPWWAYAVPFLGMLSLVAATFLEHRSARRVTPSVALTVHCLTSAVVFGVLALATGDAAPPADPMAWAAIGWLVGLSTFGGYGLYWLVLRRSGVVGVNTLMFLMAPVTTVWGALMYGEPFGLATVAGLGTGLAAVLVVRHGDPRPRATAVTQATQALAPSRGRIFPADLREPRENPSL